MSYPRENIKNEKNKRKNITKLTLRSNRSA